MKGRADVRPPGPPVLEPLIRAFLRQLQAVSRDPSREDAVHDARVAGRRLRAAGDLWIPTQPAWKRLRRRLKKLVRKLGRLRDLDVALGLLRRGPPDERLKRRALAAALVALRERERERLAGRRDDERLKRRFRRLLPLRFPPPGPAALAPRYEHILALAVTARRPEEAHQVRREIRRLRYAHETLRRAYPPASFEKAARLLRRIQSAAGAWQDRCVLRALLERSGISRRLPRLRRRLRGESKRSSAAFLKSVRPLAAMRGLFLGS